MEVIKLATTVRTKVLLEFEIFLSSQAPHLHLNHERHSCPLFGGTLREIPWQKFLFREQPSSRGCHWLCKIQVDCREACFYCRERGLACVDLSSRWDGRCVVCSIFSGLIAGSTKTGCCNPTDYFASLVRASMEVRHCPIWEGEGNINMVPVDFAASTILLLAQNKQNFGKIFHIINPHRNESWKTIFETMASFSDWTMRPLPWEQWQQSLTSKSRPYFAVVNPGAN